MKTKIHKEISVKGQRNIGSLIAKRLNDINIYTISDLKKVGAAKAYLKIQKNYPGKTIPVCYYLYGFEGALLGLHWNDIPRKRKRELLKAVGK